MLPGKQQIVEVLIFECFLEREDALNNDEDDHSRGEKVDLCAIVLLSHFDLRGHVRFCAPIAAQHVDVLVRCKTEVSDLQVKLFVNENILKL